MLGLINQTKIQVNNGLYTYGIISSYQELKTLIDHGVVYHSLKSKPEIN